MSKETQYTKHEWNNLEKAGVASVVIGAFLIPEPTLISLGIAGLVIGHLTH